MKADKHRYARDTRGNWVNAHTTRFNKHAVYFCDCPHKHRLRHVKPSGKAGKRPFADYFAHNNSGAKRKRNITACGSGGESMQHRLAKQMLRELVNTVLFPVSECPTCHCRVLVHLFNCTVKLEIKSTDSQWRYDCMAYDEDDKAFYALEVVHTHYSGQNKVDATRQDGLGIAEFRVEDIMQLGRNHKTILPNLLADMRMCHSCLIKTIDADCWWFYEQEQEDWIDLEEHMYYAMCEDFDHAKLICQLNSCSDSLEQALMIVEHNIDRILICNRFDMWIDLDDEEGFNRQPYGFSTDKYTILLIDDTWNKQDGRVIHANLKALCNARRTCNHCIMAIRRSTVISTFQRTKRPHGMNFKNCLFPILMEIERQQNICANCGIYGHKQHECYRRACFKCGFGRRY